jgi:hypothetical protein
MSRLCLLGAGNSAMGVSFPDFDKILDFTSAGSESSVSATVTNDLEYKIIIRNLDTADAINMLVNGDTSTMGYQRITNTARTIAALRDTSEATILVCPALGFSDTTLLAPSGFISTIFSDQTTYTSGTTIGLKALYGYSYDGTAALTSLDFSSASGNFTAGTRIIVYRRRVNT